MLTLGHGLWSFSPDDDSVERRPVATVTVRGNESQFTFRGDLTDTSIWPGEILASSRIPCSRTQMLKLCRQKEPGTFSIVSSFKGRKKVERP